jgi:Uri superfamily endonuclease
MQFTIFGDNYRQGSYILVITVIETLSIVFGRFRNGMPLSVPAGKYLYIGTALGSGTKASPLASRLLRHTARSAGKPVHPVRKDLLDFFALRNPECNARKHSHQDQKKLHWHVDYLLDRQETSITGIVMILSPLRIEQRLAELIGSMPEVSIIAERLGAQDASKGTHLLRISNVHALYERMNHWIPPLISA